MFTKRELEKRIAKRLEEVGRLEKEVIAAEKNLAEGRAYLQALNDLLKLCPDERAEAASLREGSMMAKARDAIKSAGEPLHITHIMREIGVDVNPKSKTSLAGSLSSYARNGRIFTRPAANTFGLLEASDLIKHNKENSENVEPN